MNHKIVPIPCAVYEDLLPLVCDGLASEESCLLVEEHEKTCPYCGQASQVERKKVLKMELSSENRILQKIKFQLLTWAFIPLLLGVFFGVSMGVSQDMFLNVWIMPLLGGISACIYKRKSFYLLIFVYLVSAIYHILPIHLAESYSIYNLLGGLQWGMLYAGLFLLGQIIGSLFAFALKKEAE